MLEYGLLAQPGITVVTGEVGAGKTTLLRHLLNQHDEESFQVGLLADTDEDTAEELHSWIAMSFGLDHTLDKISLKKNFQDYLIQSYAKGKTTILIVDEAQNLGIKALEQLRLLNNINTGQDELLKIILVGQPELLAKLRQPELMQFAQRVTVEFHLEPLAIEEAPKYINHRLQQAGAQNPIFDNSAIYAAYYFSGGIPRLLNMLCEYALIYGYSKGLARLGVDPILEVVKGRKIGGVARVPKITDDMAVARRYILDEINVDLHGVSESPGRHAL